MKVASIVIRLKKDAGIQLKLHAIWNYQVYFLYNILKIKKKYISKNNN